MADYIHSSYFYYCVMSLFYICNEAKQNLKQELLEHKTGLRPHTLPLNNLLLTVPGRCFCCVLFYLSVFVGFLFFFVFYSFYVGSPGGHLLGKTRFHCFTWCRLNYCLLGIWTSLDVIISNEVSGKEKSLENLTLNIFTSNLHILSQSVSQTKIFY